MRAIVNLWRKSRDSVTQITRVIAAICDGYHTRACDSALRRCPLKPRIAPCPLRLPQFFLLEALTPRRPIGIRLTNPRRVRSILGWLPLRPLQVTWEMTQAGDSLPPKASN